MYVCTLKVFFPGMKYRIVLDLNVPESVTNKDIGMVIYLQNASI